MKWVADKHHVVDPMGNIICEARPVPPQNGMPECSAEFMAGVIAASVTEFFFNHYVEIKEETNAAKDDT